MRWGRILVHRFRSVFRRARTEDEMRRELDLHLELLTREHVDAGLREPEARLAARRSFGSLEATRDRCRDTRRVTLIQDFLADLRYSGRVFTKSPGFALTAVLSIALGTGANTAIFSLVDIVMLRTLPVHEPRQLVELGRRDGDTLSYPIYEIIRARSEAFSGVMLLSAGRYTASARLGAVDAGDVRLSPVSGDYFAVLGVAPSIGRVLAEDDLPASNTAVITDDLDLHRDRDFVRHGVSPSRRRWLHVRATSRSSCSGLCCFSFETCEELIRLRFRCALHEPAADRRQHAGELRLAGPGDARRARLGFVFAQRDAPGRRHAAAWAARLDLQRHRIGRLLVGDFHLSVERVLEGPERDDEGRLVAIVAVGDQRRHTGRDSSQHCRVVQQLPDAIARRVDDGLTLELHVTLPTDCLVRANIIVPEAPLRRCVNYYRSS